MSSPVSQQKDESEFNLAYEPVQTEGECILKSITPISFQSLNYNIFTVISVLLLGIPVVLVYWYPKLKLKLYYKQCPLPECTDFAIMNYDDQVTIVSRKQETIQHERQLGEGESRGSWAQNSVYFVNRYMKYRIHGEGTAPVVKADIYDYEAGIRRIVQSNYEKQVPVVGHSPEKVQKLRSRFGIGTMIIQCPSLGVLFFREIVQPLYFFIVATLVIWSSEEYYYYAGVILLTTVVGIVINLHQTYILNNKIYEMAYYEVDVNVIRDEKVVKISSRDVVPGDIVFLKDPIKIPFDALVLQGSALLNECALTGESVPIVRKSDQLQDTAKIVKNKNFTNRMTKTGLICEGTTLIQVDNRKKMYVFEKFKQQYGVPVYVIRTNFVTMKGQLIRIISFPLQKTNIFQKQSTLFLVFLFVLAILSYSTLITKLAKLVQVSDLILKFLDLITITVPPGLPVSMTFGIIYAIEKMKNKDIYCVSPNKVIMGGLVDLICFDKTGTLTEDYMDFKLLVPTNEGNFTQVIYNYPSTSSLSVSIQQHLSNRPELEHMVVNMAANHTITKIHSTNENVGDPMEVKLFEFGGFRFNDALAHQMQKENEEDVLFAFDSYRGHKGVVLRRFDYDSELVRMSVVAYTVKDGNRGDCYLYAKGSPESIMKISKSETLPADFDTKLKKYSSLGFRVLAIGHRRLSEQQVRSERSDIQAELDFDGFEVFENKLKPESQGAIIELKNAQIPCLMITGDNPLTGSNIAYRAKILSLSRKLYIFNYKELEKQLVCEEFKFEADKTDYQAEKQLRFKEEQLKDIQLQEMGSSRDEKLISENDRKLQENQKYTEYEISSVINKIMGIIRGGQSDICLTGPCFNLLYSQIDLRNLDEQRKTILRATKVYARAKPNDKARIVMAYQQGLGKVVSMCGDGANDCGGLKQSDAGLSLSQTEASISAPFTSKVTNISSMVELIKECRAGLVTNFSLFNIMAMYSLIQYSSAVICQFYVTYPSDFSFLYWDIFGNFLFFVTFGYTQTAPVLSQQKPSRSLFTLTNLSQVLVMYLIQLSGQVLMVFSLSRLFSEQLDYENTGGEHINYLKYVANDHSFTFNTVEANIIFLFSNFMYIFSFVAFSISKPWRMQFYSNLPFMLVFLVSFTYSVLICIAPAARISLFEISHMNNGLVNLYVLLVALIFGMMMYFNQKHVMEPVAAWLKKRHPDKQWI